MCYPEYLRRGHRQVNYFFLIHVDKGPCMWYTAFRASTKHEKGACLNASYKINIIRRVVPEASDNGRRE